MTVLLTPLSIEPVSAVAGECLLAQGKALLAWLTENNIEAALPQDSPYHDWKAALQKGEDPLGALYEKMLSKTHRRRQGLFYTPPALIRCVLDRLGLDHAPTQPLNVYDPACGTGGFLLAAAHRLQAAAAGFPHTLVGADIDPVACRLAEFNGELFQALTDSSLTWEITAGDSLQRFTGAPGGPGWADVVVGNPPYIGEKGNKTLFEKTLDETPAWRPFYQGRMDYLYFFILLGIEALKPGGRLGFVTTRYWLTADSAARLRQTILETCKILSLVELGPTSAFPEATGQHNLVVVLEKCLNKAERGLHRPHWQRLASDFTVQSPAIAWEAQASLLETPAQSWQRTAPADIEAHLVQMARVGIPLRVVLQDQQGIISGADRLTRSNLAKIPAESQPHEGLTPGQGIFCLTQAELSALGLSPDEAAGVVYPFYKQADLVPYGMATPVEALPLLLYLDGKTPLSEDSRLWRHLLQFRPLLEQRRECKAGVRPWYALQWPRSRKILEAPCLATPRRAAHNAFVLAGAGLMENSDLAVLIPKPDFAYLDLRYFLGVLNSRPLDLWMAHRGKPKGLLREYFSTPLQALPLPPLDLKQPGHRALYQQIIESVEGLCQLQAQLLGLPDGKALARAWRPDPVRPENPKNPLLKKRFELQTTLNHSVEALFGI